MGDPRHFYIIFGSRKHLESRMGRPLGVNQLILLSDDEEDRILNQKINNICRGC